MRKYVLLTMALGALVALVRGRHRNGGKAGHRSGRQPRIMFNGGLAPKALSKTKLTPVALTAAGEIRTLDGTHPPALKEVILETDKNGASTSKACRPAPAASCRPTTPSTRKKRLQAGDHRHRYRRCFEIKFPEQTPIRGKSPLLVFNGGVKGGVTTFFIHAYVTVPAPPRSSPR